MKASGICAAETTDLSFFSSRRRGWASEASRSSNAPRDPERQSTRSGRSAAARVAQAPRRALADSHASRGLRCAPGRRRSLLALERLAAPLRPAFRGGLRGAAQTGGGEGELVRGFSRQARREGSWAELASRGESGPAWAARGDLGCGQPTRPRWCQGSSLRSWNCWRASANASRALCLFSSRRRG